MAQYCTQSQILGAISLSDLIGLTDDNGTGNVDQTILAQAIENASTDIDGAVGNIYDTPFSPVPSAISNYALSIVCYQLLRRRMTPDEKNQFYPQYRATMDFLEKVNNGEAHIPQVPLRSFPQVATTSRTTIYAGGPFGSSGLANSM